MVMVSSPRKIAINGFGRIGRQFFKIYADAKKGDYKQSGFCRISPRIDVANLEVVAINDLTDPKTLAYLLKHDSVYGISDADISFDETHLIVNGEKYPILAIKEPEKLPWKDYKVDIVVECTGRFEEYEKAKIHLQQGAKKVIISAPGKGQEGIEGQTLVLGTHETMGKLSSNNVVSNGSCTTNCISPVIQLLHDQFGVEKSLMTTAHAYTATQSIVDGPVAKDLRRGRAAGINIVPSSTGAAIATTNVLSDLKGSFDGVALRVPVIDGSIADITAVLKKEVTVEEVNQAFRKAANDPFFKGLVEVSEESLVSTDIIGNPASAIVDLELTRVIGNLVKVFAWYDNEWGYSNRLVEMTQEIAKIIDKVQAPDDTKSSSRFK